MNVPKLPLKHFLFAIMAVIHIPLLLAIYVIRPFVKIRFGYFTTGRIGHFALALGRALQLFYARVPKNQPSIFRI